MKIGNLAFPYGLFLAPMAGYTDYAMRTVAREMGAEMTVSEMVSAKALVYRDKKTPLLATVHPEEAPMAVQIFGNDPTFMAEGAAIVERGFPGGVAPAVIDINMGCPVPKIAGNGEGSALMKNPSLAGEIVRAVVRAVKIPVTVKIRLGWDDDHKNAPEIAAICEEAGASAITVHGRTREQYYSGNADLIGIRDAVRAVRIPVIGNGDILSAEDALRMFDVTGCAGLAIGRGAVGNPYLFREIRAAIDGTAYTPPTYQERIALALDQLRLAVLDKGEYHAVREARKQLLSYVRGTQDAAAVRKAIATAESVSEIERALLASLAL